jgi:nucleotide-binding universal stress UspA family protein
MKKTLVVPIDFTPVSHEALLYACELSVQNDLEIVAVHILDTHVLTEFSQSADAEVRKMSEQMYIEMMNKTRQDLDNFLEGLSVFYGDIIHPVVAHGTIYEAFNDVAAKYNAPLIVMGTHGIVGMQHVFGSKAYKVIINSPYPFLVVQERSYNTINKVYLAIKNSSYLNEYAADLANFAGFFKGNFLINILSGGDAGSIVLPESLQAIKDRIVLTCEAIAPHDIVFAASEAGADVVGMCLDEADNVSPDVYGMTQDRVLINNLKLPVYCLPFRKA